ncbi:DUF2240 family protein [Haloprofundus salilacus]|uniref:DUF2240 family protein n=1 Tax=Haloprofundus salilacus TaxID=2876190 RepID=UPI001CCC8EE5|nr:DUF2240 family protein [Haloprofundus salilacus]
MSLKTATAVPFRQRGSERLGEGEFVVVLSLDRGWFSPDQAKRLVDVAVGRGLLERGDDGDLVPAFDPDDVEIPREFVPDESILREQSTFERLLDALVASGVDKQTAVATVNDRQRRLGVTLETAAILSARSEGIDVDGVAETVRADLTGTEAK